MGAFKINEAYAKKYEERKQNEELSNLKEFYKEEDPDRLLARLQRQRHFSESKTYGERDEDSADDESSSDDEEEDEDAEDLTPALDAQILKTILAIRQKDPQVYEAKTAFYEKEKEKKKKKKAEEAVYLKDYHREQLLKQMDGEEEQPKRPLTHVEEQDALKKAFQNAVASQEEEEEEDLLTQKPETQEHDWPMVAEEYKAFLQEQIGAPLDLPAFNKQSKDIPVNADEKESDAFLMHYMLNRGWVDKEAKRLPTYREIVGEDDEEEHAKPNLLEDEESDAEAQVEKEKDEEEEEPDFEDRADDFERKYNFRFEEANGTDITTYDRDQVQSMRRVDESRKQARAARAERKKAEKEQRMQELNRLKNLQRKAVQGQIDAIKRILGEKEAQAEEEEDEFGLTGDFDPAEHDRLMRAKFGDEWYDAEDAEKPVFSDDDVDISYLEEGEKDSAAKRFADKQQREEAPVDEEMGDAFAPEIMVEEAAEGGRRKRRNRKRKRGEEEEEADFEMDADVVDGNVPAAEETALVAPEEATAENLEALLDSLYQYDYEDVVDNMPTRFKYAQTDATAHGLSAAEILLADEADLNEYYGLKSIAPYRSAERAKRDMKKLNKKQRLKEFKKKLQKTLKSVEKEMPGVSAWIDPAKATEDSPAAPVVLEEASRKQAKKRKMRDLTKQKEHELEKVTFRPGVEMERGRLNAYGLTEDGHHAAKMARKDEQKKDKKKKKRAVA